MWTENTNGVSKLALVLAMVSPLFCAAPAAAQTAGASSPPAADPTTTPESHAIEDIIVTATKTGATRLQNTPLPISAFTAGQLGKTLTSNVRDLAQFIPNMNISQVTTNPVITLRGVGTNNVFNGSDVDVTMQVDGVYLARPSAQASDFLDIQRVEVLRGPQGTLYGRNAIGGTINIISRPPTDALTGEAVLTAGNFNLVQAQAYISGAIIPGKVQVSVSGNYTTHKNYEDNIAPTGQSGVFNANHSGVRAQLRIEPTEGIDATTRVDYLYQDENLPGPYHLRVRTPQAPLANSIYGNFTKVAINTPSTSEYRAYGISEDINFDLGNSWILKSITAVRSQGYRLSTDNDGTELNNIVGNFHETERQHSQEFNLNGKVGKIDAVLGAYYFDEHAFTDVSAAIISPARIKINSLVHFYTRSIAGFGQFTYHLTPAISLTAGLRYTTEKKDIDVFVTRRSLVNGATLPGFPIIFQVDRHFHAFTPKFGIDWKVDPDVLLYASITKGYKSGGTNYAANSPATASFNPETIWSYEAGLKADLFDRRLRFNLTAFHYDYSDLQIQSSISPGVVSIGNAAQAKVDGIEVETTAKVTPTLRFDANLSYLRARYDTFTSASVAAALVPLIATDPRYNAKLGLYNASGHRLNQSPSYSGTVAVQKDFPLTSGATVTARGDIYFQGRAYYDPQNTVFTSQGAYHVYNAQLGYTSANDKWQFTLFGKNLTNRHYLFAFQANGIAPAGFAAAPRTYGVRVSTKF